LVSRLSRSTFLLGVAIAFGAAAAEWRDDRGFAVTVTPDPRRIVALSPNLAEIVYAAGAGDRLAAVVRFSDYPQPAKRLPQVGDASRLDVERIFAMHPDLVLGWKSGNPPQDLRRLERLDLPVFVTEPRRLEDIARLVRTIGSIAGTPQQAASAADAFDRDLRALREHYGGKRPVRVFYEIWRRPLLTVNAQHIISDVIRLCGGENIFADAPVLTPAVSLEAVLAARPELVLGGSSAMRPKDLSAEWRALPISALRNVPVRYVPADLIQRQTPRLAMGARVVCEHLEEVRTKR
jgi:iron complex transport system substrate-binding protein